MQPGFSAKRMPCGEQCWCNVASTAGSRRSCATALKLHPNGLLSRSRSSSYRALQRGSRQPHGWCFGRHVPAACLQPCNLAVLAPMWLGDVWLLSNASDGGHASHCTRPQSHQTSFGVSFFAMCLPVAYRVCDHSCLTMQICA